MTHPKSNPRQVLPVLFHRRWAAPILAELHPEGGAKIVTLARRTGATTQTARRTLDYLHGLELAFPNSGYGHPLRPEWLLAPRAAPLSEPCGELVQRLKRADAMELGLRKWSMPTLAAIAAGDDRFNAIFTSFAGVTPRAISLALRDMAAAAFIRREVVDGHPPSPVYTLAPAGAAMVPTLDRLLAAARSALPAAAQPSSK